MISSTFLKRVIRVFFFVTLASALLLGGLMTHVHAAGVDRDKNEISVEARPTPDEALKRFTMNVTEMAKNGKLEPFVGERVQVRRILETLSKAGNKVLYVLGEPGSGKTALVESASGQLPDGVQMFRLELNALEAGTGYRGMLEDRIEALLSAFKNNPNRILFIDEFHRVMRMPDFMNNLKPAMGRGEISMVNATTDEEYRDHVEKDVALTSRGNLVRLPKPDEAKALTVLRANKERLEKTHGLQISDAALEMTARLVVRYYTYDPILRKALDIVDRTMAREVLDRKYGHFDKLVLEDKKEVIELQLKSLMGDLRRSPHNYELVERIKDLQDELAAIDENIAKHSGNSEASRLTVELNNLKRQLQEATRKGDLQRAAELTHAAIPYTEQQIREAGMQTADQGILSEKHIAKFVATETGIPSSLLAEDDRSKLERLEKALNERVLGQEHVAKEIVRRLKIRQANVEPIVGPAGVILLDGPTGTGKTEIAKGLAQNLFGDKNRLINIALNQYSGQSGSRLLGSDPGIKDSERGGELDQIRRQPFSVLNLDEFDKAPHEIRMMFLQGFADGEIKDPMGRVIDLRNTLIVASSNFTAEYAVYKNVWSRSEIEKRFQLPAGSLEGLTQEEVDTQVLDRAMELKGVPPELRNRFQVRVIHNAIDLDQAVHIARTKLADQRSYIYREEKIVVNFSDNVARALARAAYNPEFGVRPIESKRTDLISDLLADIKLRYGFKRGSTINIDFKVDQDQKGGQLIAEMDGGIQDARQVIFKTLTSPETRAGRQAGELGRAADPRDSGAAIRRAYSRVKKAK